MNTPLTRLSPSRRLAVKAILCLLFTTQHSTCVLAQNSNTDHALIINELMVDPTPPRGLPDAEYIELYNPGPLPVDLGDYAIASGGRPVNLGGTLPPNDYLLLVDDADLTAFDPAARNVLGIDLPRLTNGGDRVTLLRGADTVSQVVYTDDWYQDELRDGGGFSLEFTGIRGEDAGCKGRWRASMAVVGGTPGSVNSTRDLPADTTGPKLVAYTAGLHNLDLLFDEAVTAQTGEFILLNGDDEVPVLQDFTATERESIQLDLLDSLVPGTLYELLLPGLTDCSGNAGAEATVEVILPTEAAAGQVIINELLFNPAAGGHDFVELYNPTNSAFQLSGWTLTNVQSTTRNASVNITGNVLIKPGQYLVLTADRHQLIERYPDAEVGSVIQQDLPSLPDEEGNLTLRSADQTIDSFDYDRHMHTPFLRDLNGVSLERLDDRLPTNRPASWASAATGAGYGTPTRPNSQGRSGEAGASVPLSLPRSTFSPDGDGYEDELLIAYANVAVGTLGRMRVFDGNGQPVNTDIEEELLATSGTLGWDGTRNDGSAAATGPYVVLMELIYPGRSAERAKFTVVLARRSR